MAEFNTQSTPINGAAVDFQVNIVDSSELKGGYSTWQLFPGGALVKAGGKSKAMTGQFSALHCGTQGGAVHSYEPGESFTFEVYEELTLTGPDDTNTVTISGKSSGESQWKLKEHK